MGLRTLVRKLLRPEPAAAAPSRDPHDLKAVNVAMVDELMRAMPHDEAMAVAIGGHWDFFGKLQAALLKHYGLPDDGYLIDVGCGAGRLAKPLSAQHRGDYLGIDLVPALVANARRITERADWRFEVIDHIGIPEKDAVADMVCFFSVLTHLLHEQSYWYLEEAHRVLKPGGRVVFTFLEFSEPAHFTEIFKPTVEHIKTGARSPLNAFLHRDILTLWAPELGFDVVEIRGGGDVVVPQGNMGQALCVFQKRA